MNFKQSKFYVEQLLQADPDEFSALAISLADWFFTNCENTLEGIPEDEHDLHLMSAPMACAELLRLVGEGLIILAESFNGDTYNGEFDWPEDRKPIGGALQAYNIAHLCMTERGLNREEFIKASQQMFLVMTGVAEAITTDDRRVVSMSLVGTITDEIPVDKQQELADEVIALFASHGIELESTLVNFQQPSDGIGESNVVFG